MNLRQACQAMIDGRKFFDSNRNRFVWITAVEIGGSIELSYGDEFRPKAVWIWLQEANRFGVSDERHSDEAGCREPLGNH